MKRVKIVYPDRFRADDCQLPRQTTAEEVISVLRRAFELRSDVPVRLLGPDGSEITGDVYDAVRHGSELWLTAGPGRTRWWWLVTRPLVWSPWRSVVTAAGVGCLVYFTVTYVDRVPSVAANVWTEVSATVTSWLPRKTPATTNVLPIGTPPESVTATQSPPVRPPTRPRPESGRGVNSGRPVAEAGSAPARPVSNPVAATPSADPSTSPSTPVRRRGRVVVAPVSAVNMWLTDAGGRTSRRELAAGTLHRVDLEAGSFEVAFELPDSQFRSRPQAVTVEADREVSVSVPVAVPITLVPTPVQGAEMRVDGRAVETGAVIRVFAGVHEFRFRFPDGTTNDFSVDIQPGSLPVIQVQAGKAGWQRVVR